jgi:hypothetical protein
MTDRQQPPGTDDHLARLRPPTVTEAEKPLRRQVAMAYRTAREAMLSHEAAIDAAEAVYFKAPANELIASAIQVDPKWFWKNVRATIDAK